MFDHTGSINCKAAYQARVSFEPVLRGAREGFRSIVATCCSLPAHLAHFALSSAQPPPPGILLILLLRTWLWYIDTSFDLRDKEMFL